MKKFLLSLSLLAAVSQNTVQANNISLTTLLVALGAKYVAETVPHHPYCVENEKTQAASVTATWTSAVVAADQLQKGNYKAALASALVSGAGFTFAMHGSSVEQVKATGFDIIDYIRQKKEEKVEAVPAEFVEHNNSSVLPAEVKEATAQQDSQEAVAEEASAQ